MSVLNISSFCDYLLRYMTVTFWQIKGKVRTEPQVYLRFLFQLVLPITSSRNEIILTATGPYVQRGHESSLVQAAPRLVILCPSNVRPWPTSLLLSTTSDHLSSGWCSFDVVYTASSVLLFWFTWVICNTWGLVSLWPVSFIDVVY